MDANQRGNSKTAQILWIVGTPIIFFVGVVGNILSIIVLSNKRNRKTSTAIFLVCLAFADLMITVVILPRWWLIYTFGFDIRQTGSFVCKLHWYLTYVFTSYSTLILTSVTAERVMCTVLPYKVKQLCNKTVAVAVSFAIGILLAGLHSHVFYGFTLNSVQNKAKNDGNVTGQDSNNTTVPNDIVFADALNTTNTIPLQYQCLWTEKKSYLEVYTTYITPIAVAIYQVVPQSISVFGSIIIIRTLLKTRRVALSYGTESAKGNRKNKTESQTTQITFTLLIVNAVFFICTVPVQTYLIGRKYWIDLEKGMNELQEILWAVFNLLFYINHAINFVLYFLSGKKFRSEVIEMFRRKKRDMPNDNTQSNSNLVTISNIVSAMNRTQYREGVKVMEVE